MRAAHLVENPARVIAHLGLKVFDGLFGAFDLLAPPLLLGDLLIVAFLLPLELATRRLDGLFEVAPLSFKRLKPVAPLVEQVLAP